MTKLLEIDVKPHDIRMFNASTGEHETFRCSKYAVRIWTEGEIPAVPYCATELMPGFWAAAGPVYV